MHSATSTHSVAPRSPNANPPDASLIVALAVLAHTSREREELRHLREREAWEREVRAIPNARCGPAGKLVLLDQWAEASYRRERGIDEPQPIWIEDRAKRVGLSPDTYGRILKAQLARAGAIERTQVKDPDTGHTRVLVRHTEAFWEPSRLAPPEPRGQGGSRTPKPKCPECGSEELRAIRWACGGCGSVLEGQDIVVGDQGEDAATDGDTDPNRQVARLGSTGSTVGGGDPNPQDAGWSPLADSGHADEIVALVTTDEERGEAEGYWAGGRMAGAEPAPWPEPEGDGDGDPEVSPELPAPPAEPNDVPGDPPSRPNADPEDSPEVPAPPAQIAATPQPASCGLPPRRRSSRSSGGGAAGGTPPGGRRRRGSIEMYDAGRYLAWTRDVLPGRGELADRGAELGELYRRTFGELEASGVASPPVTYSGPDTSGPGGGELGDEGLLARALADPRTAALWEGDVSGHGGDHSAADLALCSRLARYTRDPDRLDRLFQRSGLYGPKWERGDYRGRTLAWALGGRLSGGG